MEVAQEIAERVYLRLGLQMGMADWDALDHDHTRLVDVSRGILTTNLERVEPARSGENIVSQIERMPLPERTRTVELLRHAFGGDFSKAAG